MKDKIFIPSVITTLVFLIIFLLICIINQTSVSKSFSDKVEVLANKVDVLSQAQKGNQGEISRMQAQPVLSKAEFAKMSPNLMVIKAEVVRIQKELDKLKADFQSHNHRNNKLILIENVDKGK